jgi:hypothetical protein
MKTLPALLAALALLGSASPARAGPYSDDLSKCLVSSTTAADKSLMVKWIFSAIALNQEVAPYVVMPEAARNQLNRDTAALYMRLLTETCATQTRDAFKYEGQAAIGQAFNLLGQAASTEMFRDPRVAGGVTDLMEHFDEDKLNAILERD